MPDNELVTQVACGTFHSIAVTETVHVYAWGFGGNRRLGLNHAEPVLCPTLIEGMLQHGQSHRPAYCATCSTVHDMTTPHMHAHRVYSDTARSCSAPAT